MKRVLQFATITALLIGLAGMAGAMIWPPGTGGSCATDSVTITRVQDPLSTCHPATGDTVLGVEGIVTALDSTTNIANFGVFFEIAGGGPYSGVRLFTGATNYQASVPGTPTGGNIYYGDKLHADGKVAEFNGETEIQGLDNTQSTNDITIRRISANNVWPAYHIATPLEIDWVPGWTSVNGTANQEPWEGCLVKVKGPLKVGRSLGAGLGTRTMLASLNGGADTLAIDGFALTTVNALANGATIDSVQGILVETVISTIDSYRILLRGTDDLFAAAPPNLIDAYIVQDGVVRVIFDRPVTPATAQNTANYSVTNFDASVLSVTLEAGNKSALVEIDGSSLNNGDAETISVSGVVSSSGLTMNGIQTRTFIWGVLTCAQVQQPDPSATGLGGSPCHDHSRFTTATGGNGTRLTYRGVATAVFGSLYYMEDAGGGLRSGLGIFSPPQPLTIGHEYLLAGQIQEFDGISTTIAGGLTEGVATVYLQDLGAASVPAAVVQTIHVLKDSTCDAAQTLTNAEDYEEMLVTVRYVRCIENQPPGNGFLIAGPNPTFSPDTMLVQNSNGAYTFAADSAHTLTVTGLLNWRNGGFPWRITPRNNADIIDHGLNKLLGVGPEANASGDLKMVVSPNPARTARVSFTVPQSAKVDLGVFDLAGRRLVTLVNAGLPAGDYTKMWNGRDGDGNVVKAGVYFYRLRVADKLVTSRAIKLD